MVNLKPRVLLKGLPQTKDLMVCPDQGFYAEANPKPLTVSVLPLTTGYKNPSLSHMSKPYGLLHSTKHRERIRVLL